MFPDLVVELVDVAAAHGEHQVAGLPVGAEVGFGIVEGGGVHGIDAMGAHALDDLAGLDVAGGLLAGGVDVGDQREVGGLGEVR